MAQAISNINEIEPRHSVQFDDLTNKRIFLTEFKEDKSSASKHCLQAPRRSNQDGTVEAANAKANAASLTAWNGAWKNELKDLSLSKEELEEVGTGFGQSHRLKLNEAPKRQHHIPGHRSIQLAASNPIGVSLKGSAQALEMARQVLSSATKGKPSITRKGGQRGSAAKIEPLQTTGTRSLSGKAKRNMNVKAMPEYVPQSAALRRPRKDLAAVAESFRRQQRIYGPVQLAPPGIFMAAIAPRVLESTAASAASLAGPQKPVSEQNVTQVRTQQSGNRPSKPFLSKTSEATNHSDAVVNTGRVPDGYGAGIPMSVPAQPAIQSVSHQSNGSAMYRPASLKEYLPSLKQLVPAEFYAALEALASLPSTSKASAGRAIVNKITSTKILCTDGNVAVNAAPFRRSTSAEQNLHPKETRIQDNQRVARDDKSGSMVAVEADPLKAVLGGQDRSGSLSTPRPDRNRARDLSTEPRSLLNDLGENKKSGSTPLSLKLLAGSSSLGSGSPPTKTESEQSLHVAATRFAASVLRGPAPMGLPITKIADKGTKSAPGVDLASGVQSTLLLRHSPDITSSKTTSQEAKLTGVTHKVVFPSKPEPEIIKAARVISEGSNYDVRGVLAESILRQRAALLGSEDDVSSYIVDDQPLAFPAANRRQSNISSKSIDAPAAFQSQPSLAERLNAQREAIASGRGITSQSIIPPKVFNLDKKDLHESSENLDNLQTGRGLSKPKPETPDALQRPKADSPNEELSQQPLQSLDRTWKVKTSKPSLPLWLQQELASASPQQHGNGQKPDGTSSSQQPANVAVVVTGPKESQLKRRSSTSQPALGVADTRAKERSVDISPFLAAQTVLGDVTNRRPESVPKPSQRPQSTKPSLSDKQPRKENNRPKPSLPAWLATSRKD